ncbi:MAG: hypothetical protein E7583_07025 [Ruminococcaceae bacterium]|nr:hypothetical protein [Oscillospiraceae bacterium]
MLNIGKERECFFDEYLIDTMRTTAESVVHTPIRRETVMLHDAPWEGCGCDYHNFFYDKEYGKYRMYYLGWKTDEMGNISGKILPCYAESTNGLVWEKCRLGIADFEGSSDNNILLDQSVDNFMVFKDENPDCKNGEEYKCVLQAVDKREDGSSRQYLKCMFSSDGIHFTDGYEISDCGTFDSLNVAFWDGYVKKYRCYFRGFHKPGQTNAELSGAFDWRVDVRDIRYIESKDFITWSKPVILNFGSSEDIPLYTNVCQNYYRAPQYIIGFPTRYIERKGWSKSFEELCGKEKRKTRMETEPRFGLSVTDCVFIVSRNGHTFKKHDEAFMRPGAEFPENWVYGSCYPARGIIETPSDIPGAENELSIFAFDNHWMGEGYSAKLYRYTLRLDGFVSRHAGAAEKMVVTKPFCYDGKDMFANISTSARGYIFFTLKSADGEVIESCEMFGDSTDKKIGFDDGAVEKLSGKEVVLEMRMLDADIYAIRFE